MQIGQLMELGRVCVAVKVANRKSASVDANEACAHSARNYDSLVNGKVRAVVRTEVGGSNGVAKPAICMVSYVCVRFFGKEVIEVVLGKTFHCVLSEVTGAEGEFGSHEGISVSGDVVGRSAVTSLEDGGVVLERNGLLVGDGCQGGCKALNRGGGDGNVSGSEFA